MEEINMCAVCRMMPCHFRCPNSPEPKPVTLCKQCGKAMYPGDYHLNGVCKECIEDFTMSDWLDFFESRLEQIGEDLDR